MKWWTTVAWAALVLQTAVLLVWAAYALREVGRDIGERVWTIAYCVGPASLLGIAGLLLFFGQKHHSALALGMGSALALLPPAALILIVGGRKFDALDRAHSRAQAGRFDDPALTEIARAIDRHDHALLRQRTSDKPPDWTKRDRWGRTLLGHAINRVIADHPGSSGVEAVRALVQAGARIGPNDLGSETPLMCVILSAHSPDALELLDVVLQAGGNPNATNSLLEPLVQLPECNRLQLEVLARHGADLHACSRRDDRQGWTALMTAAQLQQWDKALFFLDQGIPANHRATDGTTVSSILDRVEASARATGREPEAGYHQLRTRIARNSP